MILHRLSISIMMVILTSCFDSNTGHLNASNSSYSEIESSNSQSILSYAQSTSSDSQSASSNNRVGKLLTTTKIINDKQFHHEYNSKGNLIHSYKEAEDPKERDFFVNIKYQSNSDTLVKVEYSSGSYLAHYKYEYNDSGYVMYYYTYENRVAEDTAKSDVDYENYNQITHVTNNAKGNIVESVRYYQDDYLADKNRFEYEYNTQDKILTRSWYYSLRGIYEDLFKTKEFEYVDGILIETREISYHRDMQGVVLEKIHILVKYEDGMPVNETHQAEFSDELSKVIEYIYE